jgi:hypothetical protein
MIQPCHEWKSGHVEDREPCSDLHLGDGGDFVTLFFLDPQIALRHSV